MSKTVTLETAKALKAAFDAAGIEMPETEFHFMKYGNWGYRWAANKKPKYYPGQTIPAPDAEELGKWLPGDTFEESRVKIGFCVDGFYAYWPGNDIYPENTYSTIAESVAHLLIACLSVIPEQIKNHLSK